MSKLLDISAKTVGKFWGQRKIEAAQRLVKKGLGGAAGRLVQAEKQAAPVATGELQDGIHAVVQAGGMVVKVVQDPWHGIVVEHGAVPSYTPIEPLEEWVEVKLAIPQPEARRVAYAISETHSIYGIDPQPYWWKTFDSLVPTLNSQYLGPVGAALVKELE